MESADLTTGPDDKGQFAASRGISAEEPAIAATETEVDDHASKGSTSSATSKLETNRAQPETEVEVHESDGALSGATSTAESLETPIEVEDYGTSRSEPAEATVETGIGHEVEDLGSGITSTSEHAGAQSEIDEYHEIGGVASRDSSRSGIGGAPADAAEMDRGPLRIGGKSRAEFSGTKLVNEVEDDGAASKSEKFSIEDQEAGPSNSQFQVSDFQNMKEKELLDQGAKSVEAAENAARQAEQGSIGNINGLIEYEEKKPRKTDQEVQLAMRMVDAVEEDAHAVARSLTTLLSSLRSALSEVTKSSVANMRVENEAAGQVQDAAIDAASKGNRFINDCLRLNEDLKGMERVAAQLEVLRAKVDHVESQASRYLSR
ncbi:hypothetical protein R1sor_017249 [Riccia sorocarpa]|uniref:BLOC-1-related complex subunit 6 C-terminal helix domain-containing protein n=1 Tax=Riccia sorocarpa TaxID=122646 RepID=A0ABD3I690_9MARC